MTVVHVTLATSLVLLAVYFVAPLLVVSVEEWFYGHTVPAGIVSTGGGLRRRLGPFLYGRVALYYIFAIVIWLGGTVGAVAMMRAQQNGAPANAEAGHVIAGPSGRHIADASRPSDDGWKINYLWTFAIAVLTCCVGRIAAVTYHPTIMRTVLLGLVLWLGVGLFIMIMAPSSADRAIEWIQDSSGDVGAIMTAGAVVSAVTAVLTEVVLLGPWLRHWGRSAREKVRTGTYSCILCGHDHTILTPTGDLPECPRHPYPEYRYNFRRKAAGW